MSLITKKLIKLELKFFFLFFWCKEGHSSSSLNSQEYNVISNFCDEGCKWVFRNECFPYIGNVYKSIFHFNSLEFDWNINLTNSN